MSYLITPGPSIQAASPIDPPLVASAYDDEFDGTTLDPSWTKLGTYDNSNRINPYLGFTSGGCRTSLNGSLPIGTSGYIRNSWMFFQPDSTQSAVSIQKLITLPSECFVWVRMCFAFRNSSQTDNDATVGFGFHDSTGFDNAVDVDLNESDASTVQLQVTSWTSGTASIVANSNNIGGANVAVGQFAHTVGIQKLNTTYHFWALSAAGNWLHIGSTTHATTFDRVKLFANNATNGAPGNMVMGFDFFRFKTGRYLP